MAFGENFAAAATSPALQTLLRLLLFGGCSRGSASIFWSPRSPLSEAFERRPAGPQARWAVRRHPWLGQQRAAARPHCDEALPCSPVAKACAVNGYLCYEAQKRCLAFGLSLSKQQSKTQITQAGNQSANRSPESMFQPIPRDTTCLCKAMGSHLQPLPRCHAKRRHCWAVD